LFDHIKKSLVSWIRRRGTTRFLAPHDEPYHNTGLQKREKSSHHLLCHTVSFIPPHETFATSPAMLGVGGGTDGDMLAAQQFCSTTPDDGFLVLIRRSMAVLVHHDEARRRDCSTKQRQQQRRSLLAAPVVLPCGPRKTPLQLRHRTSAIFVA
jgi:hypothetical protein